MNTFQRALLLAALATLAGCGGGGGIGGSGAPTGSLRLQLTDAPACGYDAVNITIQKVRVNTSASAADTDSGWYELALAPARRVNLLTLSNGVLATLGQIALPAGRYTQMRLVLAPNDAAAPLANSVLPTGGTETALTTPSGQQSGLKLDMNVDVPADKVVDAVIDFDACKSVVKRGNSGQYNLKPVINVTSLVSDAGLRVVGYVTPALASAGATVSMQSGGVPLKATVPDAMGQFVLYPVPAGGHDLVITAPGRVSAVLTGVPVSAAAYTVLNSAATPIDLPATGVPARVVSGSVTPAGATLRVLQVLSGGPTVEIAWAGVDDGNGGAFSVALPLEAPQRAAYATTWVFAPDTAAAGRYTLEAASAGALQTRNIDVNAVVPPVVFTFP
jgi:hypothetical protein